MFGHNPAPLPPHALSCLPWMLSARRNPLPPAGQLPLWLAAVGTEGVRTSRAKADRRRRERGAIAVEEEEGAVRRGCGRCLELWILEAINALVFGVPRFALERRRVHRTASGAAFHRWPRWASLPREAPGRQMQCGEWGGGGENDGGPEGEETKLAKTRRGEARKRKRGEEMIPKCYRAVKCCLSKPK